MSSFSLEMYIIALYRNANSSFVAKQITLYNNLLSQASTKSCLYRCMKAGVRLHTGVHRRVRELQYEKAGQRTGIRLPPVRIRCSTIAKAHFCLVQ